MNFARISATAAGAIALAVATIAPATAATIPSGALALLAAGERDSILTQTTDNATTSHNGSEWYYSLDNSVGFAAAGETVQLNSADVAGGAQAWSRLSWHLHSEASVVFVGDGYRLGEITDLNFDELEDFDTEAEYLAQPSLTTGRYIFTADTLPAYYPSGPQENVDLADLEGWTLCWSNLYGDDDVSTSAVDDVWAACDGEYLMLAGGDATIGEFAEINGTAGAELGDTGFDVTAALGAATVLAAAGATLTARRRRV